MPSLIDLYNETLGPATGGIMSEPPARGASRSARNLAILTQGGRAAPTTPKRVVGRASEGSLPHHAQLVDEMTKRGYKHRSPLALDKATGKSRQNESVDSVHAQAAILKRKQSGVPSAEVITF